MLSPARQLEEPVNRFIIDWITQTSNAIGRSGPKLAEGCP